MGDARWWNSFQSATTPNGTPSAYLTTGSTFMFAYDAGSEGLEYTLHCGASPLSYVPPQGF